MQITVTQSNLHYKENLVSPIPNGEKVKQFCPSDDTTLLLSYNIWDPTSLDSFRNSFNLAGEISGKFHVGQVSSLHCSQSGPCHPAVTINYPRNTQSHYYLSQRDSGLKEHN